MLDEHVNSHDYYNSAVSESSMQMYSMRAQCPTKVYQEAKGSYARGKSESKGSRKTRTVDFATEQARRAIAFTQLTGPTNGQLSRAERLRYASDLSGKRCADCGESIGESFEKCLSCYSQKNKNTHKKGNLTHTLVLSFFTYS